MIVTNRQYEKEEEDFRGKKKKVSFGGASEHIKLMCDLNDQVMRSNEEHRQQQIQDERELAYLNEREELQQREANQKRQDEFRQQLEENQRIREEAQKKAGEEQEKQQDEQKDNGLAAETTKQQEHSAAAQEHGNEPRAEMEHQAQQGRSM
ncbi:TPA: hypothetical protein L5C15_005772 [Pseudomonas aeruginosa]|uniref:hypothetical protein n=1 Tax=Pseudomonas aeruginosa TaxID=287 RepID=UPI0009413BDE|nr:hypothetical protein [Pseudomonas aeruginosa]OKS33359.1 hypothetical protein BH608_18035 [Pseudomonas aeruginosa]HBO7934635.1 hypothetical protein [Pseudomonas aeruginosa]HBO8188577.1 hypothetical protein [Pseudomonas aeruginosa]HBO8713826.1 hypothetical protein [Pseudomonas aeruginosa]